MSSSSSPYELVVYGSTEAETSRYYQKRYRRLGRDVDLSSPPAEGGIERWPDSWPGLCYYDGHPFEGQPMLLVLREDTDTGHFAVSFAFAFCSKQCAFAYYAARLNTEKGRRLNMAFQSFVRKVLKQYEPFSAALPKEFMKAYSPKKGLYDTVQQWREASKCGVVVAPVQYPYYPVSMVYEEVVVDGSPPDAEKTVFDPSKFKEPPVKTRTPAKDIVREASKKFERTKKLTSSKYVADDEPPKDRNDVDEPPKPKQRSKKKKVGFEVRKSGKNKRKATPQSEDAASDEEAKIAKRRKSKKPDDDDEEIEEDDEEEIEEVYESDESE